MAWRPAVKSLVEPLEQRTANSLRHLARLKPSNREHLLSTQKQVAAVIETGILLQQDAQNIAPQADEVLALRSHKALSIYAEIENTSFRKQLDSNKSVDDADGCTASGCDGRLKQRRTYTEDVEYEGQLRARRVLTRVLSKTAYSKSGEVGKAIFPTTVRQEPRSEDFETRSRATAYSISDEDVKLKTSKGSLPKSSLFEEHKHSTCGPRTATTATRATAATRATTATMGHGVETEGTPTGSKPFWDALGAAAYVSHNGFLLPETYQTVSSLEGYWAARYKAALFDQGFVRIARLQGSLAASILDRLMGCNPKPSDLSIGQGRYTCFTDQKAKVLDCPWLLREREDAYLCFFSGFAFESSLRFLTQYLNNFRQVRGFKKLSLVDISSDFTVVSLDGPCANYVLRDLCHGGLKDGRWDRVQEVSEAIGAREPRSKNSFLPFRATLTPHVFESTTTTFHAVEHSVARSQLLKTCPARPSAAPVDVLSSPKAAPLCNSDEACTLEFNYSYSLSSAKPVKKFRARILALRWSTAEDGYLLSVPSEAVLPFLTSIEVKNKPSFFRTIIYHPDVTLGTVGAWNMLRLEAGVPLGGIDFDGTATPVQRRYPQWKPATERASNHSPLQLSLLRLFDPDAVKQKLIHGVAQIEYTQRKPRYKRRVGFHLSRAVPLGAQVISYPERSLLGEITSVAWSPLLNRRIAMGFVGSDVARHGQPVLIRVFDEAEENSSVRRRERSAPKSPKKKPPFMEKKREAFNREFVVAKIVSLPIVEPRQKSEIVTQWQKRLEREAGPLCDAKYKGLGGSRKLRPRLRASLPTPTPLERPRKFNLTMAQNLLDKAESASPDALRKLAQFEKATGWDLLRE